MTTATRPPFVIPATLRPGLHKAILTVLQNHVGQRSAINSKELAVAVRADERICRVAIQELIKSGVPICSSVSSSHSGYYLPISGEEVVKCVKDLKDRGQETINRAVSLEAAGMEYFKELPRQVGLF